MTPQRLLSSNSHFVHRLSANVDDTIISDPTTSAIITQSQECRLRKQVPLSTSQESGVLPEGRPRWLMEPDSSEAKVPNQGVDMARDSAYFEQSTMESKSSNEIHTTNLVDDDVAMLLANPHESLHNDFRPPVLASAPSATGSSSLVSALKVQPSPSLRQVPGQPNEQSNFEPEPIGLNVGVAVKKMRKAFHSSVAE
ncbi:unnamed protein product [Protopolystoma xenopodis]|uniref:Uncharacterized protein n=1 Tax=Protopolystoma xenopodis TaxID=117903 RepID=A0A3S5FH07_9PLAT|nr:unnamed protein product [Protopolystoma xenopodis]